ncbi:hypothetical protein [Flavobacterium sp. W21_SRS_FM6]|uniref:hypothetical protein n=1 Tax=Flavobacterium sp. W21_SRS_FM6 TaxID=3240268 RepID=UPI003F902D94
MQKNENKFNNLKNVKKNGFVWHLIDYELGYIHGFMVVFANENLHVQLLIQLKRIGQCQNI